MICSGKLAFTAFQRISSDSLATASSLGCKDELDAKDAHRLANAWSMHAAANSAAALGKRRSSLRLCEATASYQIDMCFSLGWNTEGTFLIKDSRITQSCSPFSSQ